jgi:predicted permease
MNVLSHSVRMLSKRPWFTLSAVAVLSLGIGANTAVFSLVNSLVLRPLVLRQPEQLVGLYSRDSKVPDSYRGFSYPNYADLRDNGRVFAGLAAHNLALVGVAEGDTTRRLFADIVSANYFETLGVPLYRGRAFSMAEERPMSGLPVAIVSYNYWKKLGAGADILGQNLRVNGHVFTVVGVAPDGFTGTTAMTSPELYLPLGMYESVINDFEGNARPLAARDNPCLVAIGRLQPGLTQQGADAQLGAVSTAMERAWPVENKNQKLLVRRLSRFGVSTSPLDDSEVVMPGILLLAMAGVVLLIAALNVANMMLARGMARRKEIAIRLALGGGRSSIVRQLFVEGLLLAVLGGVAGLALSYGATTLLVRSLTRLIPLDIVFHAAPDVRVLAATMGFCVFSTLLFGFWPAWNLSRPNLVTDLKASGNEDPFQGKPRRILTRRNLLVIAQVSLSLMLLTAAGLFVRQSARAAHVEPGFRLENGAVIEVDASLAGYDEQQGRRAYSTLLERLRRLPGVESAASAATVPFGMVSLGRGIQAAGDAQKSAADAKTVGSSYNIVSEDYFRTMGIPLLRGREFLASDVGSGTPAVAILDKLAAKKLWPDGDALGRQIRLMPERTGGPVQEAQVVGVVGTVRERVIGRDEQPHIYVAAGQQYQADTNIHLKLAPMGPEGEQRLLAAARQEVRLLDSRLPVVSVKTMRGVLESSADTWIVQTGARMFAISGFVALLLAVIGLYAVRAYSVARRTREIGIRMALGASAGDTMRLMLREGLMLTAVGLALGLLLSLLVGRVLAGVLYQVNGADPVVFGLSAAVLAAVSLLACYVPARKAAHVDPLVALRYE